MVTTRFLQHVRDKFGCYRCTAFVLLVLAGIGEERNDRCDALRTRDLARVYHDAQFHERRVDLAAAGVDNVHIVLPHGLCDADIGLTNTALGNIGAAER